jgi:hypothetical protein
MRRWFGYVNDAATATGGSTLDTLEAIPAGGPAIPAPTEFVPVTSGQVDPGLQQLDRDDEVRGRRGNTAPISFASAPGLTFDARCYPKLLRKLVRSGLGGAISSAGASPASVSSTLGPLQVGNLPSIVGWLVRESQVDRATGLWVSELELNFPIDEEGSLSATLAALYHTVGDADALGDDPNGEPAAALPTPAYTDYEDTFMLRDAIAYLGAGAGVEIEDLAGFGFTLNNGLVDDMRSRFRPRKNIEVVDVDGTEHKLWYPQRHKLGAQAVAGRVDLSDVDPDSEARRLVTHAEKLVFEVAAAPLGTDPEADEMMRLTFYNQAPLDGGAEPLAREGDQVASYEFTAYVVAEGVNAGKDVEATFVGTAALT